ncbi:MAG: right-handed parallel beta-helix repeat-containing protein [Armatimonadota bacterium]
MCLAYWPLCIIGILLASLCYSAPPQKPTPAARPLVYVAPGGNDNWSGKLSAPNAAKTDGPVASLTAAQAKVRQALASGATAPITVQIKGGTYQLSKPLIFTGADSGTARAPVTYAAAPGEKPVFSGGQPLTGWRKGEGNLWVCDIPEVKAGNWYFNQLFINDKRATRARTPNNDEYLHMAGTLIPLSGDRAKLPPETRLGFRFKPGEIKQWDELSDVNVVAYHAWTSSRHWVKEVNTENNTVHFTNASGWPIGYWDRQARYFVENFKEALDTPGEWYLSRAEGRLYYWPLPGENMARAQAIAPRVQHLLELKGDAALGMNVEHLTFRGLSFQHSEWVNAPDKVADGQASVHLSAAIVADGARDCVFDSCEILHVGEYGMILGDGCKRNKITRCELRDLGGGGIRLGTTALPPDPERQASHNTVDNCLIYDGGYVWEAGIGVWIGRSSFNTVSHNDISELKYSGCSVGWSWGYAPTTANNNIFEYNHIHHIGRGVLSDMGGIYSLGVSPGTVERFNHIHDIYSYSYGGWALYTDEGSSDILLENNFCYNTKSGGFHQHYGQRNLIRNNIFGRAMEANIISSRTDIGNDLTFEHNIVSVDNGTPLGGNLTPDRFTLRNNLYWDTAGNELCFYGETFEQWQAKGKDEGSIIANPWLSEGKLNTSPGGPLPKIGFKPFDISTAGLYGDKAWVNKPTTLTHREAKFPPPPGPKLVNDDFELTPVGEMPEGRANEEGDATIRATDETAATGKHSLKFTDAPNLAHNWQPHLVYNPNLKDGLIRFAFSARLEEGAILWQEWRDNTNPYKVGPSLRIDAKGDLTAGGQTLMHLDRSQWVRFEITCGVGKRSTGTWDLTVTAPNAQPQSFKTLPFGHKAFRTLNWLGFVSEATEKTVFYLDDLKMQLEE